MTISRRSSGTRKRRVPALEQIAYSEPPSVQDADIGRPVLGDLPGGDEPDAAPMPPPREQRRPPAVPVFDDDAGYSLSSRLVAVRHLLDLADALDLPLAHVAVGDVSLTLAPGGGRRGGTPVSVSGGEASDLYRQYGGPLYAELQARLSAAAKGAGPT